MKEYYNLPLYCEYDEKEKSGSLMIGPFPLGCYFYEEKKYKNKSLKDENKHWYASMEFGGMYWHDTKEQAEQELLNSARAMLKEIKSNAT